MASSVNADDFLHREGEELLAIPGTTHPTSPYGAHKLILDEMARMNAYEHGYEAVAVRFGGVTADNSVKEAHIHPPVWLSRQDATMAIGAVVEAPEVPNSYAAFYAVSDNTSKIHDTSNPFGWQPNDNYIDFL